MIHFYKIVCPGDEVYVGSTKKKLSIRWTEHKSSFKTNRLNANSKILFEKYGIEHCKIELIESRECTQEERYRIEGELIRSIPNCVNVKIMGRDRQTYYIENKDEILEKRKQHYEINKEVIISKIDKDAKKEYNKQYHKNHLDEIHARHKLNHKNRKSIL